MDGKRIISRIPCLKVKDGASVVLVPIQMNPPVRRIGNMHIEDAQTLVRYLEGHILPLFEVGRMRGTLAQMQLHRKGTVIRSKIFGVEQGYNQHKNKDEQKRHGQHPTAGPQADPQSERHPFCFFLFFALAAFLRAFVFLLLGYPVAFALAANGLLFALIGIELGLLSPALLQALPERIFGIMRNDTLLAIPFFTFMGLILERSGMAEDLLETIGQMFGPVRGGLAYAVIFVGAMLAASTGVVAASVISMGLISLPIMLRYGYDRRLASGVIAASGTLAQIIPPSLVLIVLADQLGRSVGDMYKGAILPGLALTGLYFLYVFGRSFLFPHTAPALPPEARTLRGAKLLRRVLLVLVPPLALIFLVLGTIFLGIATPTEGGAMGATGALALALHSIAAGGKLYSEQVESIMPGPLEAVEATGANRLQTIIYAVVPQIIPPYISYTMYRWDINVRMSTIIGFVGGGGIGFLLQQNINLLNYRAASTQMLAIAVVVASMDYLSSVLRERYV